MYTYPLRAEGLDKSLFATLCEFNHPRSISELTIQYRMNKEILKLCNQITYGNRITCANDVIANATAPFISQAPLIDQDRSPWMMKCLSPHIDDSVIFLNHTDREPESPYSNDSEASMIIDIIEVLKGCGVPDSNIGVISPYNAQVDLIRRLCVAADGVEVNTIDQYQGKDKSIILISFVRNRRGGELSGADQTSKIDILMDERRVNVALTRAKHKLIMVGCLDHLSTAYEPMRAVARALLPSQIIDV